MPSFTAACVIYYTSPPRWKESHADSSIAPFQDLSHAPLSISNPVLSFRDPPWSSRANQKLALDMVLIRWFLRISDKDLLRINLEQKHLTDAPILRNLRAVRLPECIAEWFLNKALSRMPIMKLMISGKTWDHVAINRRPASHDVIH